MQCQLPTIPNRPPTVQQAAAETEPAFGLPNAPIIEHNQKPTIQTYMNTFRCLIVLGVAALFSACADKEVVYIHHHDAPAPSPSSYQVVHQYDNYSR